MEEKLEKEVDLNDIQRVEEGFEHLGGYQV